MHRQRRDGYGDPFRKRTVDFPQPSLGHPSAKPCVRAIYRVVVKIDPVRKAECRRKIGEGTLIAAYNFFNRYSVPTPDDAVCDPRSIDAWIAGAYIKHPSEITGSTCASEEVHLVGRGKHSLKCDPRPCAQ